MKEALIGGAAIDEMNDPFPDESLKQCLESDSVLLACIGGYKWDKNPRELRPESGLLKMRKEMGLFANLRPAKVLPQLIDASTLKKEIIEGVDVMVVRELTGDVYFGTPKGIDIIDGERVGYNNMIYSESEILRIARVAGELILYSLIYIFIFTTAISSTEYTIRRVGVQRRTYNSLSTCSAVRSFETNYSIINPIMYSMLLRR